MRWNALLSLVLALSFMTDEVRADGPSEAMPGTSFSTTSTIDPAHLPLSTLNFTGFTDWNVTRGAVDIVNLNGPAKNGWFYNYHGAIPSFNFVDLDGTSKKSGQISTKSALNLTPGNYQLSFDVAGNLGRRPTSEGVTVRLSGLGITQHYELPSSSGFTTKTIDFTVDSATSTLLSFANESDDPSTMNDDQGPLLANVSLTNLSAGIASVPEPTSILIGVGLAGGLLLARRFKRQAKVKPA
jgi:hypothetical protein